MVTITCNVQDFTRNMTDLATNQIPFAVALTLSRCADEAVATVRTELPSRFIVRRSWISKGFRVRYAKKNALVAEISHLDPFMTLQEFGGEKDPNSAPSVAVPVGARPTPTALTPQSKWPGKLGRRFYVKKNGLVYEFVRTGRRSKGKVRKVHRDRRFGPQMRDPNLKLMYILRPSVQITPRLGLVDTLTKTANARFAVNFEGFMKFAVRTAK